MLDERMKALHQKLKEFKKSESYVRWQRYSRACEDYMKRHPNKYIMRFNVENSYSFAELVSVKYKISNVFNIRRANYSLGYYDFTAGTTSTDE